MAGLANPVLTLTRDRAAKTVRAVARCRINFNPVELEAMQQGLLRFRLRARLFGADPVVLGGDSNLFTFVPPKIYPDATPNNFEDATFEETLGEVVLDEDLGTEEIFARFELTNELVQTAIARNSPVVSGRV